MQHPEPFAYLLFLERELKREISPLHASIIEVDLSICLEDAWSKTASVIP